MLDIPKSSKIDYFLSFVFVSVVPKHPVQFKLIYAIDKGERKLHHIDYSVLYWLWRKNV